ncbi:hypothetical protein HF263_20640 [Rhizobium leguminosarum]|jgi:hypothetical protein|uniref:hypothetical protein n=1 Tax=Rhizobium leguminosarum TaxID=384 RepID=UPI000FEF4E17|nr:hypothetical protein [Rhizobium leguminosarum]MBY2992924.1 hypothetical protein [Rhizobium leguminosarum]MBY3058469.1 hypothetical protein [Rhizobium leguminosarum]RWY79288.1 hypothetical protein EHI46_00935 [Rhizobium leguminosarum]
MANLSDFYKLSIECPTAECGHELASFIPVEVSKRSEILLKCPRCYQMHHIEFQPDDGYPFIEGTPNPLFSVSAVEPEEVPTEQPDYTLVPYDVFYKSYKEIEALAGATVTKMLDQLMSKLIYQQFITMMETFLSDTFVEMCERDTKVVDSIVIKVETWRDRTIKIRDIAENEFAYREAVLTWLRGISWHDMEKADKICRAVFSCSVYPDEDTRQQVELAVSIRHDLVHRNGRTKEGQLRRISPDDLYEVASGVQSVAKHIHNKYMGWIPFAWSLQEEDYTKTS